MQWKQQQSEQQRERVFSYYNLQLRTRSNSRNAPKTYLVFLCKQQCEAIAKSDSKAGTPISIDVVK